MGSSAPEYRQQREKSFTDQISAKDAEIKTLQARLAELEGAQKKLSEIPESLNRQPSGSAPIRDGDEFDINKVVRFK
jgi:hypothetical protein